MSDSPPPETEVMQDIVAPAGDTSSPRSPPADDAEGVQKAASRSGSPQPVSEAKADPAPVEKGETREAIQ